MTTNFTASNGITIEVTHDGYLIAKGDTAATYATAEPLGLEALEEFFQAERDEQLGRWRDTIIPSFIIYPNGDDCIRVFSETTGISWDAVRPLRLAGLDDPSWFGAAARYFAAHPEPKPWHSALPGEAWVLTIDGAEEPATVGYSTTPGVRKFYVGSDTFDLTDPGITAGRKLWPTGDDDE